MSRRSKLFLLILCPFPISLVLFSAGIGQETKNTVGVQYQKYEYTDKKICLTMRANRTTFCDTDSVEITISVHNRSTSSLYLFNQVETRYILTPADKREAIILEYGGMFEADLDFELTMKGLQPDSLYTIRTVFSGKNLRSINITRFFRVMLNLGYVPDVDSLIPWQYLSPIVTQRIENSQLVASPLVVERALVRHHFAVLYFNLHDCNESDKK